MRDKLGSSNSQPPWREYMQFETHDLPATLANHVESIFHFKGFVPDHSIERVVPTGHLFVLFELDGLERNTFDNETLEPNASFRDAWISGMHRDYISISAHPESEMFVIQFKAHGAYPFLHLPIDSISDQVVPGEQILDGALLPLRKQLLAADESADKFAVAERWLVARYNAEMQAPQSVVDVIDQLQTQPASRFADVCESFPGTQKHLIDQFKKYVGLTPKIYHRIMRFNEIFAQIQRDQFISWADIASLCGYSDQSHFIREFRHFSGFNPEEFIRQGFNEDDANFFPLDRDG